MRSPSRVSTFVCLLALVFGAACDQAPTGGAPTSSAKPASKADCDRLAQAFQLQGARMAQLGRTADLSGSVEVYRQYADELDLITVREGDLKVLFESHRDHVKRAVSGGKKASDPATKSQGTSEFMVEAGKAGDDKRRIDALCASAR